jgi:transposase
LTFEVIGSEVTMRVRRHRRYSTEFKLQLVEAYLAGDGSAKGLADEHGICHSLILIWAEKYRKGELTLDVQREEQMQEAALKVADLERKVGQLTMELDRLKRGLAVGLPANNGSSSIISGPGASPSHGGAA